MQRAMGYTGLWTIDGGRASLETPAAADLPRRVLLPALVPRPGEAGRRARTGRRGRDQGRQVAAAGPAAEPQADLRRRAEADDPRQFRAPGAGSGALQGRRPGAHPQHQPDDAYEAAALCPRQARHGRGGPRLSRLSRYRRDRRRRQPAMALYGRLFGAANCGARRPTRRSRCRSRRSSPISNRHERIEA